jgi:hypothetical protein
MDGLFCVYDRVAEEYSSPTQCRNVGVAWRMFQEQVLKMPPYAQEDYWLVRVGNFDSHTGLLEPLGIVERIQLPRALGDPLDSEVKE